mmetsp:Transcript_114739/g.203276  ORF Transcript_114739/g.203276 Transcript_114739/m.203276 type:complete len:157 (+) Transcript_114739:94-564(+)
MQAAPKWMARSVAGLISGSFRFSRASPNVTPLLSIQALPRRASTSSQVVVPKGEPAQEQEHTGFWDTPMIVPEIWPDRDAAVVEGTKNALRGVLILFPLLTIPFMVMQSTRLQTTRTFIEELEQHKADYEAQGLEAKETIRLLAAKAEELESAKSK